MQRPTDIELCLEMHIKNQKHTTASKQKVSFNRLEAACLLFLKFPHTKTKPNTPFWSTDKRKVLHEQEPIILG